MKSFAMAVLLFSAAVAYPQSDAIGRVIQVPGHVPGVPASLGSSPVTGVPFSAEVVNQTTQVLQDGNPVRYQTRGKIFRDSTGRTRNEFSTRTALDNAAQISQQVIIDDPVAHVSIRFSIPASSSSNMVAKTAFVEHTGSHHVGFPASTIDTKLPRLGTNASHDRTLITDFGSVARKSLGTSTVEGLTVLGTQITRTIKAGANGNERPIVIVEVFWYSPDLQQLLLEDIQDPQWGRRIMGVTDIHRSEPDPALFQIPPDYTVTEVNPH